MVKWFRTLLLIPLLIVGLTIGGAAYSGDCGMMQPVAKQDNMTMNSAMAPCHDIMPDMQSGDVSQQDHKNHHDKNQCNCAFSHCSGNLTMLVPAVASQLAAIDDELYSSENTIDVHNAPLVLERPPKYFS